MKKYLLNNKGMYTIEAVLVMSTVLMILFAMLFAFMLLYQNVVIMHAAAYAVQQGAEDWTKNNDTVYYRLSEITSSSIVQNKLDKIEEIAKDKLSAGILPLRNSIVEAKFQNSFIQRKITVKIEQSIPFPIPGVAKLFGDSDVILLSTESSSVISEPTEYTRNFDFGIELAERAAKSFNADEILSKMKNPFDLLNWTSN